MLKKLIILVIAVFLLGWLSNQLFTDVLPAQAELVAGPLQEQYNLSPITPAPTTTGSVQLSTGREKPSPADRLKLNDVHVTDRRVVIDGISGRRFETAIFTNTNSMDPLIDDGTQAIQIVPLRPEEIKVGDIVSYDSGKYGVIIHRVIQIGQDEQGWYAIVKGDNNPAPDPVKVRFSMNRRVLVGVLY